MPSPRTARTVVRFMLAWFALYLGAAVASPLLTSGRLCRDLLGRRHRPAGADRRRRRAPTRLARLPCTARVCACGRTAAPGARARGDAAAAAGLHPCRRRRATWPAALTAAPPPARAAAPRPDPRRGAHAGDPGVARPLCFDPARKSGPRDRASPEPRTHQPTMERPSGRAALALAFPLVGVAQEADDAPPVKTLGVVTVTGGAADLAADADPDHHGGRHARADRDARINATDSEDALKYLPSLLVRKRYIGDYNHAILSSRASGTGNSARSAVYADGILLSNYLGNGVGGISFAPRWGLVTPEEIERVDVHVRPVLGRLPGQLGRRGGRLRHRACRRSSRRTPRSATSSQPFELYNTRRDLSRLAGQRLARQPQRRLVAWWVNVNRTDSDGQPLTFATTARSAPGTPGTRRHAGDRRRAGPEQRQPALVASSATARSTHTAQDHAKLKLAYDLTPTLRASYALGCWQQRIGRRRRAPTCATPRAQPVYSGPINIDGRSYTLTRRRLRADQRRPDAPDARPLDQEPHPGPTGTGRSPPASTTTAATTSARTPPQLAARRRSGGAGTLADRQRHRLERRWRAKGIWRPQGTGRRAHRRLRRAAATATSCAYLTSEHRSATGCTARADALLSDVARRRTGLSAPGRRTLWRFAPGLEARCSAAAPSAGRPSTG